MIEAFRDQSPASDQRIAQNQSGIVPDKTVAHRGRIADEDDDQENEDGPDFFHETRKSISRASRFANVYVDLAWSLVCRRAADDFEQRACRWSSKGLFAVDRRDRARLELDARETPIVRARSWQRMGCARVADSGFTRQKWFGVGKWHCGPE